MVRGRKGRREGRWRRPEVLKPSVGHFFFCFLLFKRKEKKKKRN